MSGASSQTTNLRSIRYQAESMVLEIEFYAGGIVEFYGVPVDVYHALIAAAIPDRYLETNILRKFRHRRLLTV